ELPDGGNRHQIDAAVAMGAGHSMGGARLATGLASPASLLLGLTIQRALDVADIGGRHRLPNLLADRFGRCRWSNTRIGFQIVANCLRYVHAIFSPTRHGDNSRYV